MYTLIGQNFINMIKSFYINAKIASGGKEVIVRCPACGDSKDPKHAHLYISVPQRPDEMSLYHCKLCNRKGIVDDLFLRKIGCEDSRVLVDVLKHNEELKKNPKYIKLRTFDIYPLRNNWINPKYEWNKFKLDYINNRIGSAFTYEDILKLKMFLNLYDVLNQNKLDLTRDPRVTDALNQHFIGFISYDNSYSILRKCDNAELYRTLNKRYINYNLINKFESNKDFYVLPTKINIEDPIGVNIHIAEGVFDVLSIYHNLNGCNQYNNIYISAAGKSYYQALQFILEETGIINYTIHIYPDYDVTEYELNKLIISRIIILPSNIVIHRNGYANSDGTIEKDYGVPANRIKDTVKIIYEQKI